MLICKLIGHNYRKYLQYEELEPHIVDGWEIQRSFTTLFKCTRCMCDSSMVTNLGKKVGSSDTVAVDGEGGKGPHGGRGGNATVTGKGGIAVGGRGGDGGSS